MKQMKALFCMVTTETMQVKGMSELKHFTEKTINNHLKHKWWSYRYEHQLEIFLVFGQQVLRNEIALYFFPEVILFTILQTWTVF